MLGGRIKQVRKSKCLTQQLFAARLNTSYGFISEVEAGKKIPGGEFLSSLKREFPDVDLNWLLTGEEKEEEGGVAEPPEEYKKKGVVQKKINQLLDNMPEKAQRDVLKYAEEKKQLEELKRKVG